MDNIKFYVFDLDNTLYPKNSGLLQSVSSNITKFIMKKLNLNQAEADLLREKYKEQYGITLAGLIKHHGINSKEFDEHVYNLDYDNKLKKDEKLIYLLNKMNGKKIIYTNSGEIHTHKILSRLYIKKFFHKIITIEKLDFFAKPTKESFKKFIYKTSVNPNESLFFEDSEINLQAAKKFGFKTVLVGNENNEFDLCIKEITELIMY